MGIFVRGVGVSMVNNRDAFGILLEGGGVTPMPNSHYEKDDENHHHLVPILIT